ncbi:MULTISPECIES: methyltransferase domain-containing protein [Pacificimonas]|uniref:Methyltransferase domain-containing protein n=1 Tax=Pacificimonas aurantium TaxID=1250540 RepID=A0ABS7WFC0_9SPHN|nr:MULTISPECIES: methyltransferase domain-containing protein [Pacificimonas]MBZ6377094.1 methyltransferase domain-containing protein [Pacificimonas aurantium]
MASDTDAFEPFDRSMRRRVRARAAFGYGDFAFLKDAVSEDLAARAQSFDRKWSRLLDLGAHDGRLGKAIAADEHVFADPAPEFARATAGVVCDEDRLPFRDASFDLVVSSLSLHGVNDLPGALVQVRRALQPGGVFLASFVGGMTATNVRRALLDVDMAGEGAAPRLLPMVDPAEAPGLLQRAGFDQPVVDIASFDISYGAVEGLRRDVRGMGEGNYLAARASAPLTRSHAAQMIAALEELRGPAGKIPVKLEVLTLTGICPG